MQELLGLQSFQVLLLFALALGAGVALLSLRRRTGSTKLGPFSVVPLAGGTLVTATAALTQRHHVGDLFDTLTGSARAGIGAVSILVAALAAADYLLVRVVPLVRRVLRPTRVSRAQDVAGAVVLAVTMAALVPGLDRAADATAPEEPKRQARVLAELPLPGNPMDIVFTGSAEGYMTFGEGEVARFRLVGDPRDPRLELDTVARGLDYPRGLAFAEGTLYVAEMGALPCPDPFPYCKGDAVPGVSQLEGALAILGESRARVTAFEVRPDGSLGEGRRVLDDLPVASSDHGVNGVDMGPDGRIYVTVGNVEFLWDHPDEVAAMDRPHLDRLGTVLAYSPDEDEVEVFARGLRNVYGLTWDSDGELYGVDNDGPTLQGWRGEEVLRIREGAHYGYPAEDTVGPRERRTDGAVWILDQVGSAGVAWSDAAGLGDGLLVGTCSQLVHVALSDHGPAGMRVDSPADVSELLQVPGCITAIAAGPESTVVAALFGWTSPALYVLAIDARG